MIPILIVNRDILDNVIEQIQFFRRCPDTYIVLIDNASTYPPLLEWYRQMTGMTVLPSSYIGRNIHFVFYPVNYGPRAGCTLINLLPFKFDYYFLSDADMDYSDLDPKTFLSDLQSGLERYPEVNGASASIRIDDLPATKLAELVRQTEAPNWQTYQTLTFDCVNPETRQHHYIGGDDWEWYSAGCDTAGVLRRVNPQWRGGYSGIRSTKHVALHKPWYFSPENWSCPSCGKLPEIKAEKVCLSCLTARQIPPDFAWFYAHANPDGTTYTAFMLDKSRSKL